MLILIVSYCVCLKHITLCICITLFFPTTFLQYRGILSKKVFLQALTANKIQLFIAVIGNFSPEKSPQRLLDKCSHLFISILHDQNKH